MRTNRRRLGALMTATVVGLGVSACGGDETSPSDDTPAQVAETAEEPQVEATEEPDAGATQTDAGAGATQTEEPAQGADDGQATSDAMGEGEEIPVEEFLAMVQEPGEETLSSYTMTMAMEAEGESIDADGAVDLSGDQPAMSLTMTMAELGEVEMITIDGEIYLAMPGVTPEGMYIQSSDDLLGQAGAMDDLDVTTQWEAWEEGAQEVRYLGDEEVDGTELGHYRIMVDAAAAAEAMGQDTAGMEDLDTVVYDVWLDSDNLMRQLAFDMEGAVLEMSMDNWGEEQTIEAPAADQVMQMDELDPGSTNDG